MKFELGPAEAGRLALPRLLTSSLCGSLNVREVLAAIGRFG